MSHTYLEILRLCSFNSASKRLVLVLSQDNTVEITADEITDYDAAVYSKNLQSMCFEERDWHAEIVECICNAVGKSANDE